MVLKWPFIGDAGKRLYTYIVQASHKRVLEDDTIVLLGGTNVMVIF